MRSTCKTPSDDTQKAVRVGCNLCHVTFPHFRDSNVHMRTHRICPGREQLSKLKRFCLQKLMVSSMLYLFE